jgi:3-oxoadipate enol-lactonase
MDPGLNVLVREAGRHMDRFSRIPGWSVALEGLIRTEALGTTVLEHQTRLLAHLVGRTTEMERRQRRERDSRRERRGGPPTGTPGTREPVAFWHEGGQGPVLLLINGWSASGLVWPAEWVARLERRFRVVRIDNRGTGWSRTAPAPFTIGDLAEDAAEVLRAIGAGPATVVGLSMGGMIAQDLALRHPDLVGRLILAATRPPAPDHIPAPPPVLERELGHLLATPRRGEPLDGYFRALWEPQCGPGFAARHPERLDELIGQVIERPAPRAAVINQLRAIAAWTAAGRPAAITAPTVVVHGELDELMPVGNGMRLARLVPAARYVELPGVGHLVPLEAPDLLADVIEEP